MGENIKVVFFAGILAIVAFIAGMMVAPQSDESLDVTVTGEGTVPDGEPHWFRLNLSNPTPGTEQPTAVGIPSGRNNRLPTVWNQSGDPPGTPVTVQVMPSDASGHTHEGGADPGNHCHYWVKIGTTWYQVHC